jgi:hypothetical protein
VLGRRGRDRRAGNESGGARDGARTRRVESRTSGERKVWADRCAGNESGGARDGARTARAQMTRARRAWARSARGERKWRRARWSEDRASADDARSTGVGVISARGMKVAAHAMERGRGEESRTSGERKVWADRCATNERRRTEFEAESAGDFNSQAHEYGRRPCAIPDEDDATDTEEEVAPEEPGVRHAEDVGGPNMQASFF